MSDYSPSEASEPDDQPLAGPSIAPHRHLPKQAYTSVEYPGPVSHPSALLKVITQDDLNECFNTATNTVADLEMRYRMEDSVGAPVRGARVPSQKLLLKVVRKKRKFGLKCRRKGKDKETEGVFTAEVVGPVTHTVRFRCKSFPQMAELG